MQGWTSLTMKFEVGGVVATLKRNPSVYKSLLSLNAMKRALKEQGQGDLIGLGSILLEMEKGVYDWLPH